MIKWFKRKARMLHRAWRSWTVNWGVMLMLAGGLQDHLTDVLPWLHKYLPTEETGVLVAIIGVVVILLRIKTTAPLGDR